MTPNATDTKSKSRPSSAILGLEGGGNLLVKEKVAERDRDKVSSGGVIYTDQMPELKALLDRYEVVSAVFSEDGPKSGAVADVRPDRSGGFRRAVVLGGLPAGLLVAGVVMMIGALAGGRAVSNPYLALYLIIAGLGLGLTSWTALRHGR